MGSERSAASDGSVEVLAGGVANAGAVVRVGDHVLRPTSTHTPAIHRYLHHVRAAGCDAVPEVVGLEPDGRERLVFVDGDVPLPPFPAWSYAPATLASTAALLRRIHDASVGFDAHGLSWSTEMADPRAGGRDDVICHNDVCPENVVYRGGVAVAIVDWEFAAPGRRLHDVAALARMCVPIDSPEDAARLGRGASDPFGGIAAVADGYGLSDGDRVELVEVLGGQIERGGAFVQRRVDAGDEAFIAMWEAMGGAARFERRRRWFDDNRQRLVDAVT
ncbi:phosphotransferase [Desertimonas flava]|uniref:phosphotransferase n=1 Tax=Desertimonas flava TaxID=2064846 RepID=UPI000E342219|nr:phosphotransferase [Desertimonas flava]